MTYGERDAPMEIGKAKDNFDKDRKPKYFNYNVYRYMEKYYRKSKKKWDTKKCFKYNKIEHIAKDCKIEQNIKNCSVQKETNDKKNEKQKSFIEGPE